MNADFTQLDVWKKSHQLMIKIYEFARLLPREEKYNRYYQIIRSVSSISANISEGSGRWYFLENISFCRIARGSLFETKNHLIAIRDLKQADRKICDDLIDDCDRIRQILNGYIRFLKNQKVGKEETDE